MNNKAFTYNSPRIERARRLKSRHRRIEAIANIVGAALFLAALYGIMWLLIWITLFIN